jgi:hypothetical protein
MIDTNSVTQAIQQLQAATLAAQEIHSQLSPWTPALAIGAAWCGREISRACNAAKNSAEWLMAHGGIIKIIGKIFYNQNA